MWSFVGRAPLGYRLERAVSGLKERQEGLKLALPHFDVQASCDVLCHFFKSSVACLTFNLQLAEIGRPAGEISFCLPYRSSNVNLKGDGNESIYVVYRKKEKHTGGAP